MFASPGPTNMPQRVLDALSHHATDFSDPEFQRAYRHCRDGLKRLIGTSGELFLYTASGHGAWEATMTNLLSLGETVLMLESGLHSDDWALMCMQLGFEVARVEADCRIGVQADDVLNALQADIHHRIKAVCVVHNETATGVMTSVEQIRAVMDASAHPALLIVDAVSSLGSAPVLMDKWCVDAVIGSSQKGLMLPVGLAFTAVNAKGMKANSSATTPRAYFDWTLMLERVQRSFSGTAPNNLLFALSEAIGMIEEEGDAALFVRHERLAAGVRAAVHAWSVSGGPQLFCRDSARASPSVTAILMPDGFDAEPLRQLMRGRYNVLLASGLGALSNRTFRIGHMGDLNESMLLGMLACVEMGFRALNIPHGRGGVVAAMRCLLD